MAEPTLWDQSNNNPPPPSKNLHKFDALPVCTYYYDLKHTFT